MDTNKENLEEKIKKQEAEIKELQDEIMNFIDDN